MAKLGDSYVVWDVTDPGLTLAAARDRLVRYLSSRIGLPSGELQNWLANALADHTQPLSIVCTSQRPSGKRWTTIERELQIHRRVVALRENPVTAELCDQIARRRYWSQERRRVRDKIVCDLAYEHPTKEEYLELRLTIGSIMRVEDAVAYAAIQLNWGQRSAYNIFTEYRARNGRPTEVSSLIDPAQFRQLSSAERDLVWQMLTPCTDKEPYWLSELIDHIRCKREASSGGILGLLVRGLSNDKRLPFSFKLKRGKGHPEDRSLISRNMDFCDRVRQLTERPLTHESCAQLEQQAPGSSITLEAVRGGTTIRLQHPKWQRQLNLKLGARMSQDDAIQYAAQENGLKFRPARKIFLEYRKALSTD